MQNAHRVQGMVIIKKFHIAEQWFTLQDYTGLQQAVNA
jgi:hypothetical protein